MSVNADDIIQGVELQDSEYTVVQSLIRNKYKAYDANDDLVLQGKQKMFKLKEEFPFLDKDGEPAFTVQAGGVFDVAGNYTLTDDVTDEPVIVLDKNWTVFTHEWKLRDPDTETVIATIDSTSTVIDVLRHLPYIGILFHLIPHEYEITDANGDHIGSVHGEFSIKDRYTVTIEDASGVPREAIVAAAMVIDAIEGN
ncbi:LURP-one-related/scramblase family protein [Halocatena pleomorpha]|uniref:LURP-one-related family protein n=1 Tax=Halocatena pleomorpha TaxID=1785090 RepID=A0A3P3RCY1_9EURY|nr:hypothetical protein [Halocatena pleomorpha]RRJ30323.1 hypothetical protein EIK79_10410 [Halocatena pleomorpha]